MLRPIVHLQIDEFVIYPQLIIVYASVGKTLGDSVCHVLKAARGYTFLDGIVNLIKGLG
jgi:hypothetical protein